MHSKHNCLVHQTAVWVFQGEARTIEQGVFKGDLTISMLPELLTAQHSAEVC